MIVSRVKQNMSIKEFMKRDFVRYVDLEILEKCLVICAALFMLQCGAIVAPIISAGLGGI
jgi:predicted ABC-type exoprotein transport system permease subunit